MATILFATRDNVRVAQIQQITDAANVIREEKLFDMDTAFLKRFQLDSNAFIAAKTAVDSSKLGLAEGNDARNQSVQTLYRGTRAFIKSLRLNVTENLLNPDIFRTLSIHPTQLPSWNNVSTNWIKYGSEVITAYQRALAEGMEPLTINFLDKMTAALELSKQASTEADALALTHKDAVKKLSQKRAVVDAHLRKLAIGLRYDLSDMPQPTVRSIMRRFGFVFKTRSGEEPVPPEGTENPEPVGEAQPTTPTQA